MAIVGVGVDIVRSSRLRQAFDRHGDKFLRRYLHPKEIHQFQRLSDPQAQTQFLASRWAVKEATYKAFKSWRILFPDILLVKQTPVCPIELQDTFPPYRPVPGPVVAFDGAARHLADALDVKVTRISMKLFYSSNLDHTRLSFP
ncbi:hypothetical protein Ae201684P_008342 [Aphanomyces euteiches]|uniref:4'-phosphopantetheinyl transferase domain-containing protein n=1 Tax=Aphanomyces euteiches TaxID=100861 RepID=A0A6G0XQ86_9STRA|nr:hypothetical protein Ae201684_002608 [Aphanomyces euteiches]KAH9092672.1 hypothetical protein Ae201684P_008342 [Aphanomyces euteiches]